MHIGKTIKQLRKSRKLTQEQLAGALGVSVSAVSQWETKRTMPDIELLVPLAHIFGISADELLGMESESIELTVKERTRRCDEYLHLGEQEYALSLAEETYQEFPNNLSAIGMYAWLLNATADNSHPERWIKSIQMSQKILQRHTEDKERIAAAYRICCCYAKLGDKNSALEYARKLPRSAMMNAPFMLCKFDLSEQLVQNTVKEIRFVAEMLEAYAQRLTADTSLPSRLRQQFINELSDKVKKISNLLEEKK